MRPDFYDLLQETRTNWQVRQNSFLAKVGSPKMVDLGDIDWVWIEGSWEQGEEASNGDAIQMQKEKHACKEDQDLEGGHK